MSEEKQENVVVLEEVKQEETPGTFDTEGLVPEEIKMAEEHGFKVDKGEEKKDGEHEEQSCDETKEDIDGNKEEEEVKPTFDEIGNDWDKLKSYTKAEKDSYHRWRLSQKKGQKAQQRVDELQSELELGKVKDKAAQNKIEKIREALGSEELTVEQIQKIIGDEQVTTEESVKAEVETKLKKEDDRKAEYAERIQLAENIGASKYEDFENISILAREVITRDPIYQEVLDRKFQDSSIDENQLVEAVVAIARLNPNFGKTPKEEEAKAEDKDVAKAIKNSKKKVSSASVGGGGGTRTISHNDLTVEDAARLTTEQWSKLPEKTKKRLLMG